MLDEIEDSWNSIQSATAKMREAAANTEWENVLELAVARHHQLLDHFAKYPIGPENAEFYRDRINDMLNGEQELQMLATNARREVMRSALTNTQNHRAVGAYLATATR